MSLKKGTLIAKNGTTRRVPSPSIGNFLLRVVPDACPVLPISNAERQSLQHEQTHVLQRNSDRLPHKLWLLLLDLKTIILLVFTQVKDGDLTLERDDGDIEDLRSYKCISRYHWVSTCWHGASVLRNKLNCRLIAVLTLI